MVGKGAQLHCRRWERRRGSWQKEERAGGVVKGKQLLVFFSCKKTVEDGTYEKMTTIGLATDGRVIA